MGTQSLLRGGLLLAAAFLVPACGGGGGGGSNNTVGDLDGDGITDDVDNDLDGDGRLNQFDDDVDGDGAANWSDFDADSDGDPNPFDVTPFGPWFPNPATLFATTGTAQLSFGDVPVGQMAGPGEATIQNDTLADFEVTAVNLVGSGGGTFALDLSALPGGGLPFSLPNGGSASFHVTYTPKDGVPNLGRVEVVMSDVDAERTLVLDLLGQGLAPKVTVAPTPVVAGAALAGVESRDVTLEIRNEASATGDLRLTGVDFANDASGQFSLVDPFVPVVVPPGGSPVSVRVRFSPDATSLGTVTGSLRIHLNPSSLDVTVPLSGIGAGWQGPSTTMATDLATPGGSDAVLPVWLAGTTRAVVRSAGPDGVWGDALSTDDEIVVMDSDPDGDETTADARVVVRWTGFNLTPQPAGRPVDAGDGRHVFFLGAGLDGGLGTPDDQVHVLDTESGTWRSLAAPNLGGRKSEPVIVDPATSRVVIAAGVSDLSNDVLLVYENLLGDLSAIAPTATVNLGAPVPDLAVAVPVAVTATTVVTLGGDVVAPVDSSDRRLDDGDEGLVQVRSLGGAAAVTALALGRPLTETEEPTDGDAFARPVPVGTSAVLVATEGATVGSQSDDQILRIDGVGTASPTLGATLAAPGLSGIASRPVPVSAGVYVLAGPGANGAYGNSDDALRRLTTAGSMALASFGPSVAIAGGGGVGSRLVVFGSGVLVPTGGANHVVGDADDRLLHLDPAVAGNASVLGSSAIGGGLFSNDRTTSASATGAVVLDARFVVIADRGDDHAVHTADDVLRILRDLDGDGVLGDAGDDLDKDGVVGAADAFLVPAPFATGTLTPVVGASDAAHFLTFRPGADGVLGAGRDDVPVVWWLRGNDDLP